MYKHPGVYIEHVPSGVLAIEAASTSIACFIGPVKRGPVNEPTFIFSRSQFAQKFGPLGDSGSGIRDMKNAPDYFGFAVNAFYDNGGRQAFVMRIDKDGTNAKGALGDPVTPGMGLYLTSKNPGAWGSELVAKIDLVAPFNPVTNEAADPDQGYLLEVGHEVKDADGNPEFIALESYSGVFMAEESAAGDPQNYVVKAVTDGSDLVTIAHQQIGGQNAGENVSALKGGSLAGLDPTGLAAAGPLNLDINGAKLRIEVQDAPWKVIATRDPGGADDAEEEVLANPIANADDLAAGISAAVNKHNEFAGFAAKVNPAKEMYLIPADDPNNAAVSVTLDAGGAGGLAALLGFDANSAIVLPAVGTAKFLISQDTAAVGKAEYDKALEILRDYRSVSIIVLPGVTVDKAVGSTIVQSAIGHAEFMKNRVVIVDPPDTEILTAKSVKDKAFPTSTFSALYHPWLTVNNPHFDADTNPNRPMTFDVPPSGMAAGMWARIDGSRGVWKAPAGLEASVRGSNGPNRLIGNDIQDQLNEWGVNCIRSIIGPPVIWGARTLATKVKPDQRYVPVRRTSAMIGESLYNALQAVVFEPNKHTLWASLRASANDFMDQLFRAGAFQGEKASQAYYVKCGLGQTMTQADIDAGIVRLVVGYAPLKPAEFVVVQLKQIVGQTG